MKSYGACWDKWQLSLKKHKYQTLYAIRRNVQNEMKKFPGDLFKENITTTSRKRCLNNSLEEMIAVRSFMCSDTRL